MKYLADWCRHLSWKETANKFHTSWHKVFESVRWVVEWGLKQRSLEGITAIGVDEIQWRKGHKYLTLVYQINQGCVRLLWIGLERTEVRFTEFFNMLARKVKRHRICVFRYVEALFEGYKGESRSGGSYSGSFSYCGSIKQGIG